MDVYINPYSIFKGGKYFRGEGGGGAGQFETLLILVMV